MKIVRFMRISEKMKLSIFLELKFKSTNSIPETINKHSLFEEDDGKGATVANSHAWTRMGGSK